MSWAQEEFRTLELGDERLGLAETGPALDLASFGIHQDEGREGLHPEPAQLAFPLGCVVLDAQENVLGQGFFELAVLLTSLRGS